MRGGCAQKGCTTCSRLSRSRFFLRSPARTHSRGGVPCRTTPPRSPFGSGNHSENAFGNLYSFSAWVLARHPPPKRGEGAEKKRGPDLIRCDATPYRVLSSPVAPPPPPSGPFGRYRWHTWLRVPLAPFGFIRIPEERRGIRTHRSSPGGFSNVPNCCPSLPFCPFPAPGRGFRLHQPSQRFPGCAPDRTL